ncbi:MAG: hypothetical protein PF480_03260 [Roseovarius sp.]|jgi:transposase-like protein|nr:hypothetical protein [Roseovarius sp.]
MSDFIKRPQIEVLSAADGDRRRCWSDDDKLRIVEESFVGDRQAAATAHYYTAVVAARPHKPKYNAKVECAF